MSKSLGNSIDPQDIIKIDTDLVPVNVTVTDTPLGATITRDVTLTYKAASPNIFAGILGLPAFLIGGGILRCLGDAVILLTGHGARLSERGESVQRILAPVMPKG